VVLVAVSKMVQVERLHAAVAAGMTTLGENRVQEAAAKVEALPEVTWHLVGHLQGNKAARAVALFDVIESVDSVELAQRLDRLVAERSGGQGRHVGRLVERDAADEIARPRQPHLVRNRPRAVVLLPEHRVRARRRLEAGGAGRNGQRPNDEPIADEERELPIEQHLDTRSGTGGSRCRSHRRSERPERCRACNAVASKALPLLERQHRGLGLFARFPVDRRCIEEPEIGEALLEGTCLHRRRPG
jgi:hypothetical protein